MKGRFEVGLAVLASVTLGACDSAGRPRIGIATNLDFADAAALAVADAEAEWGELPADTVIAVEWITRAAVAIRTASELAQIERLVAVVGHSNSAASLASAPVYNANRIVQLSPQSSASAYSDAGPYSFRLVPPDERQGRFIAESLLAMEGVRRIVILYVNDDYGRGLRTALVAALAGRLEIEGEAPHLEASGVRVADLDLTRRVVEEARPDAVVWLGRPLILQDHLPVLLPLLGETPIIGSDALGVAARFEDTSLWRGVWYVDFIDIEGTPRLVEFGRRFRERFERPASTADALTYDAVRMLLRAIREGATTGPQVREWLDSLGRTRPPFDGVTGAISFEPDGDVARSYVLRRVGASSESQTGP